MSLFAELVLLLPIVGDAVALAPLLFETLLFETHGPCSVYPGCDIMLMFFT